MPAYFAFLFHFNLFLYSFILKFFVFSFSYFSSLMITLVFALLFSLKSRSFFLFLSVTFSLVNFFFLPLACSVCIFLSSFSLTSVSVERKDGASQNTSWLSSSLPTLL